jgi:RNase H-fold protein (predicted Holliday junction resolvase)
MFEQRTSHNAHSFFVCFSHHVDLNLVVVVGEERGKRDEVERNWKRKKIGAFKQIPIKARVDSGAAVFALALACEMIVSVV